MNRLAVTPMELGEVLLIRPPILSDQRGNFCETYNAKTFAECGVAINFVQDNQSLSKAPGTLRGLHYQLPPFAQAKLVRVTRGRIWDVVVDIRRASPTFGRWTACELSADDGLQIYVPEGFAHGFVTLEPDTQVNYKVSNFYCPSHDRGIRWDDPSLALPWPIEPHIEPLLSPKDAQLPTLAEAEIFQ